MRIPAPPAALLDGLGGAIAEQFPGVELVYDPAAAVVELRGAAPAQRNAIERAISRHRPPPPAPQQRPRDRIAGARTLAELKDVLADLIDRT